MKPTDVEAIAALAEPVRRALYDAAVATSDGITRDAAATAVGCTRALAAFHLDKLIDEGLLVADYRRPNGRTGRGAGRPTKHYRRADRTVTVNLPPRSYDLLSDVLATTVGALGAKGRRAAESAAFESGRSLATKGRSLRRALTDAGFEPTKHRDGSIHFGNCPFESTAQCHTDVVCSLNRALIEGMIEAAGDSRAARLDPADGRCCVVIEPA